MTIGNKINSMTEWLASHTFITRFALVIILIILIFVVQAILIRQANNYAIEFLADDLKYLEQQVPKEFSDSLQNVVVGSTDAKTRLEEQYSNIRDQAKLHLNIVIYFYSRYYMAIVMATLSGLMTAVALIFISKSGWSQANRYVVTVFMVMSVSTAFFGAFPALFKQKENIDENRRLYITYISLENKVRSYVATGEDENGVQKEINDFIHGIDEWLAAIHSLPLEFEPGEIPKPADVFKDTTP